MTFPSQSNARQDVAPHFGVAAPTVSRAEFSFGSHSTGTAAASTSFSFQNGSSSAASAGTGSIGWGVGAPSTNSSTHASPFGRVPGTTSFPNGAAGTTTSWQPSGSSWTNSGFGQPSTHSTDASPFTRVEHSSSPFLWPSPTPSTRDSPFNSSATAQSTQSSDRYGFRFEPNTATAGPDSTAGPSGFGFVHSDTKVQLGSRHFAPGTCNSGSSATQDPPPHPFAKPFTAPTANPFAKPTANPFAVSKTGDFVWTANPFGKPSPSPFSPPTSNPFANPGSGAFAKPAGNPFAKPTAKPFAKPASSPFVAPTSNPFAPPAATPFTTTANPFAFPTGGPAATPSVKPFSTSTPAQTAFQFDGSRRWGDCLVSSKPGESKDKLQTSVQPTPQTPCFCWPGSNLASNGHQLKRADLGATWGAKTTASSSARSTSDSYFRSLDTLPTAGTGTTSLFTWKAPTTTVAAAVTPTSTPVFSATPAPVSASPEPLVAAPDVNPYGVGSFGDGLVEEKVKSALSSGVSSSTTLLFDRHSPHRAASIKHHKQSPVRLSGRVGLRNNPLELRTPMKTQPRFPCSRPHRKTSQSPVSTPSTRIVDSFRFSSSFSRLALSKRALRIQHSVEIEDTNEREAGIDAGSQSPAHGCTDTAKQDLPALPLADSEDTNATQDSEPHSSCLELLGTEYFTVPSMRELQQYSDDELARVENFTVGRRGCGQITFDGSTDVRGLQLDTLVVFSHGEVVVYPDDDAKPAVGRELNKCADVQLHKLSPGEHEARQDFLDRLETHTKALGAEFLGYDDGDESGGVWKFRVKHF